MCTKNLNPELNREKPLKEKYIIRDLNLPGIFVRKLRKRRTASKAQAARKKEGNTRRYDTYHACFYCGKLIQHIQTHTCIVKPNAKKPEVREILKKTKSGEKPDFSSLRKLGDHKHNCSVLAEGVREILLSRRPSKLDVSQFGPCPHCKQWLLLKNTRVHFKKCSKIRNISKRILIVQSQVLSGVIDTKPSKLMLQEVFTTMLCDEVGKTAKKDKLIIALGETWLRRSIDNREKRSYYTSQHMRLMARLLLHLREIDGSAQTESTEENTYSEETRYNMDSLAERINSPVQTTNKSVEDKEMTDYLQTQCFGMVIEAALKCCIPYFDDITLMT